MTIEKLIEECDSIQTPYRDLQKIATQLSTINPSLAQELDQTLATFVARVTHHGNAAISYMADLDLETQVQGFIEELLQTDRPTFLVTLPAIINSEEDGVVTTVCEIGYLDPLAIESILPGGVITIHDLSDGTDEDRDYSDVKMRTGDVHHILVNHEEFGELINRLRGFHSDD